MTTNINQLRMSMLNINYQAIDGIKNSSSKINQDGKKEEIYAKDGDFKYEKAMDYNGDGIVTYDEYMRYCEENAVSQYNENPNMTTYQKITDTNHMINEINDYIVVKKGKKTFHKVEM